MSGISRASETGTGTIALFKAKCKCTRQVQTLPQDPVLWPCLLATAAAIKVMLSPSARWTRTWCATSVAREVTCNEPVRARTRRLVSGRRGNHEQLRGSKTRKMGKRMNRTLHYPAHLYIMLSPRRVLPQSRSK